MDLSAVFSLLRPMLKAEGQKLVDDLLFPELNSIIEAKVSDPVLKGLALALLPIMRSAVDAEIAKIA